MMQSEAGMSTCMRCAPAAAMGGRGLRLAAAGLMAWLLSATPATAQARDEVAALREEIRQLRLEVQLLREELRSFHPAEPSGSPRPGAAGSQAQPAPDLDLVAAQVAEHAQTKVESSSRLPVRLFGTVVTNTFYNTGEPAWMDNPDFVLPPRADVPAGSFGSSVRQSQVGAMIDGPAVGPFKASGLVTVDFYGGLVNFRTGNVMGIPRMVYAYARLDSADSSLLVGQDQMLLAPRNPTSLASIYFPGLYRSGNLYLRAPQIQARHTFHAGGAGHVQVAGAVMAPVSGDFRPDAFVFITPALSGERSRRPALQGRVAWAGSTPAARWEVGLSGHHASEQTAAGRDPSRAAALDFDLEAGAFGLGGEWFLGRNIDAFGGSISQVARSRGGFFEARLRAGSRLDFNGGLGIDQLIDRRRFPAPMTRNWSLYGNLLYQFMPELVLGFEYRRVATSPLLGRERRNHHLNLAFAYSF